MYAASNDPREHGPGGKGKLGTVYTISEVNIYILLNRRGQCNAPSHLTPSHPSHEPTK